MLLGLGTPSMKPEQFGCDFLWLAKGWGTVGVQRKELGDLLSSMEDGRLAEQTAKMKHLGLALLIVEGRPRFTLDGELLDDSPWRRTTRRALRALMYSVQSKGIWYDVTADMNETAEAVRTFEAWTRKGRHSALDRRPKPRGEWGTPSDRDYALHLLQGLPGVGPQRADVLLAYFEGKGVGLPVGWKVGFEDLKAVPGIGKVRAETMWRALGGDDGREATPLGDDGGVRDKRGRGGKGKRRKAGAG